MADATSLTPPSPGLSATLLSNKRVDSYSPRGPENVNNNTISMYGETFKGRHTAQRQLLWSLNNV